MSFIHTRQYSYDVHCFYLIVSINYHLSIYLSNSEILENFALDDLW